MTRYTYLFVFRRPFRRLYFVVLFLLMVPVFSSYGQKVWSLEDCIGYAIANNIQIKQQKLNLDMQENNVIQSKAALLPGVNANASHSYNYGRTVDRFTNSFATQEVQSDNFYLSANLTVFNGFQMLNTIARNRLSMGVARYEVEKMQNDVFLNIATAYLNILFCQELARIASEQLETTRLQVERTGKLVDAGTVARGNLMTIEAQAASEELQLVTSQNNLDLSYLTLTQLLDLPTKDGFEITRPQLTVPDNFNIVEKPDQIFAMAVSTQPEIKAAELKVDVAFKDLKIARGAYMPSIILQGSYGTGYSGASESLKSISLSGLDTIGYTAQTPTIPVVTPAYKATYEKIPFDKQINDNLNKSIGFYMSIPIFNGLQVRNNVSRSKIAIENARLSLTQAKNQLNADIQRAWADATAAVKKYSAAKKALDATREAFQYTEQKFNVGVVTSFDYNEAKKNLAKSESELLQAKYEYVFKRTILDFYMGKPISLK